MIGKEVPWEISGQMIFIGKHKPVVVRGIRRLLNILYFELMMTTGKLQHW